LNGRNLIAAALTGLLLSGCAALPGFGPRPLDTYELTAPEPPTTGRRLPRRQILIAEPSALKALDGENIVIRETATALQYLDGAQWADRLPKIVQARLAEAYQSTGRVGGVGLPGQGIAVDDQILAEIRAFEIRIGAGDIAYVEIAAKVLNDRNGVVRATRVFSAGVPVSGTGNDAFVAALDQAFARVGADIVNWSLRVM
jgi:cholesterol transport system auxiliary component